MKVSYEVYEVFCVMKYLGVISEGGVKGSFESLSERMKNTRRVICLVKYAKNRSGGRFVVGRER